MASGYSLEGNFLNYARIKLLEPTNFGPTGTIQNSLNITSDFSNLDSITNVGQLNSYDIIFIGSVFSNNGSFSTSEINILKAWSAQEKKVLIIAEQPISSPISTAFGFPESTGNQDPTTSTIEDSNRNVNIFSGPFGNVSQITQWGSSQGYFLASCIAPALARNANGNATILYDTTYNDILIADTDFFNIFKMQSGTSITNNSEKAWANLWAWAVREVLTGTIPVTGNNVGQTTLISSSPACEGSQVTISVSNILGSIIMWETSTDNGNSWNQIDSTNNLLDYDNPVDGQTFRAVTSIDPTCPNYITSETTVNVVANPTSNQPMDINICDDTSNDGIEIFDLTSQNNTVLGSQSASDYSVLYFNTQTDADANSNSLLSLYTNISNPETIYVRLENNNTGCYSTTSFDISVSIIPLAALDPQFEYTVYPNDTVPITIGVIPDNFTASEVTISWTLDGSPIAGNGLMLETVFVSGLYEAKIIFNNAQYCSNIIQVPVGEFELCKFPQGISPVVSPGLNDEFDLTTCSVNELKIFNRYGALVYSKRDYTSEWHGQSNDGQELTVGTYFYIAVYDNGRKSKSSWVYISRF